MDPKDLTHRLLEEITDGFSEERKLGEGAFGTVYRGVCKNGEEIAVKVLEYDRRGLDDKQFQNEFHNLMRLEHANIVRLVGYCYETQHKHTEYEGRIVFAETTHRALCLEYLCSGSLENHLSDEFHGLDWHTRYKIIKGTCEGLKYIHGLEKPIYHLDLKPANILLDKNMVPKLADFGLSELFGEEQTRITKSLVGTIGYLPPEYLEKNVVSKKLDIFSLGVVMIKIIAGPRGRSKSAEMPPQEFIDLVQENWTMRLQAKWSGCSLEAYCHQVKTCTEIALNCVEIDRHRRPNIVDIINKLNEMETVIGKISRGEDIELLSVHHQKLPWNKDEFVTHESSTASDADLHDFQQEQDSEEEGHVMHQPKFEMIPQDYPALIPVDAHPSEPWIMMRHIVRSVYIWNYQTKETVNLLQVADETRVSAAKFIARKQWFVAGDHDGYIRVHTCDTMRKVKRFKAHSFGVVSLDIHGTEPYVLSAGWNDPIKMWNWKKGWECIRTFDMEGLAYQVKFNPKHANNFASASMNGVQIWSTGSSCREFTLSGHESVVECFDYFTLGDQLYLITVSWDNTAKIWNYQSRTCVQTLKGHMDRVCTVCSHPDLPILITGSNDGTVRLWSSTTFKLEGILDFELGRVTAVACVKGSRRIVIGYDDGLAMTEIDYKQPGATMSKDHMNNT